MNFKLISSTSIDSLNETQTNFSKQKINFKRRKFVKLAGAATIGTSFVGLSNLIFSKKSYSQCYVNPYGYTYCDPYAVWYYQWYQQQPQMQDTYGALILAQVKKLTLSSSQFSKSEPISGLINLANEKNEPSSGNLALTLVDSRSLDRLNEPESFMNAQYSIPERTSQTYSFNGIQGQYPGNKKLSIWTQNDYNSSDLIVYA